MVAHISLEEAQQWFQSTKLQLEAIDAELEATASAMVLGHLADSYDTTTWVDSTSTPSLVRKIISMLHGAWLYNRVVSEQQVENAITYGDRLERAAMTLLESVAAGNVVLTDTTEVNLQDASTAMEFWPTDAATANAELLPEDAASAPRAFSMGKVF